MYDGNSLHFYDLSQATHKSRISSRRFRQQNEHVRVFYAQCVQCTWILEREREKGLKTCAFKT